MKNSKTKETIIDMIVQCATSILFGEVLIRSIKDEFSEVTWLQYNDFLVYGIRILYGLLIAYFVSTDLIQLYYGNLTGGRYWQSDKTKYKLPLLYLIRFYKNSDPYRLDIRSFPKGDWHNATGIILGKKENRIICSGIAEESHVLVVGAPGCGKTSSIFIPSILQMLKLAGMLICDIKGDILKAIKKYCKNAEDYLLVFDPEHPENSIHFDPLMGISEMSDSDRSVFIESLAITLIKDQPGDGKFFTDGARNFFCAIAHFVLFKKPNADFSTIVNAVLVGSAESVISTIMESECIIAQSYIAGFVGANEKNTSGCFGSLLQSIRPFSIGKLSKLFSRKGHCMSINDLLNGKSIFLEIPEDKLEVYQPVLSMIFSEFALAVMRLPDMDQDRKKLCFFIDEAGVVTIPGLAHTLATCRSKGLRVLLAVQSLSQLTSAYGQQEATSIINTITIFAILGGFQDVQTREFFSKLIGTHKVLRDSSSSELREYGGKKSRSVQEYEEQIFKPEDFGQITDQLVIYYRGRYIKADKTYYFK